MLQWSAQASLVQVVIEVPGANAQSSPRFSKQSERSVSGPAATTTFPVATKTSCLLPAVMRSASTLMPGSRSNPAAAANGAAASAAAATADLAAIFIFSVIDIGGYYTIKSGGIHALRRILASSGTAPLCG